jgi:polysaccharide biosynthesis transport protein
MSLNGPETPLSASLAQQMSFVAGFLRRRYLTIVIFLLLALACGALYMFTAVPVYTASSTMMIEARKSPLQESLLGLSSTTPDPAWIDSQIQILTSQSVAAYVVKQLRLADDPQFVRGGRGPLDKLLARVGLGAAEPNSDAERVGAAVAAVMAGLQVKRVGASYLVKIDFRSQNPEIAAKVANGMIDAYIFDQLNAKYQANRRAGDWLQERLQSLREQAATAERAVIEFKAKNNIVKSGETLMNEKELSGINGQLASARAHGADLQARLERIRAVREAYQQERPASPGTEETVSEAMSNGIINRLQSNYLDLINREADWSVRYGKNHTAVVNLRRQIREIRSSIREELGRIEETTKSEYEISKKRQDELEKGLAQLISQSNQTNQAQVALFSLEAAAQSYRRLYDSFLARHTETVQQQSFPVSDARPVSQAFALKTSPQPLLVWPVATFAGAMLGIGLAAFREIKDRGFRTREQVRAVLETECLALIPLLPNLRSRRGLFVWRDVAGPVRSAELATRSVRGRAEARCIESAPRIMRTIVDRPSSAYAEAVRALKLTVDLNKNDVRDNNVIGLTSCLASEGKSSLAAAMATLIAQGGARVVLLDCDLRNPSLSRSLAPDARVGFLDVVAGKAALTDTIWRDQHTNMSFLPMVDNPNLPNATEMLASREAKSLFGALQMNYDYVIVDLAPLVAGVEVRATSKFIDSYLLVIEWGATKIEAVQYALRNMPGVRANIAGVVLNKVNMAVMGRYDSYGAEYYYGRSRYTRSIN